MNKECRLKRNQIEKKMKNSETFYDDESSNSS